MENKKLITILILITTIVLAVIALFTALRLYQLGQEPTTPSAKPKAARPSPKGETPLIAQQQPVCELAFNVGVSPSPSPSAASPSPSAASPSPSPSSSPSPSPSASPPAECWHTCDSNSQCPGSLVCQETSGVKRCVNKACPNESDCVCPAGPSPSPSPSPSPAPPVSPPPGLGGPPASPALPASTVPTQQLPEAGFVSPTAIFSLGGLLLLVLGLLL